MTLIHRKLLIMALAVTAGLFSCGQAASDSTASTASTEENVYRVEITICNSFAEMPGFRVKREDGVTQSIRYQESEWQKEVVDHPRFGGEKYLVSYSGMIYYQSIEPPILVHPDARFFTFVGMELLSSKTVKEGVFDGENLVVDGNIVSREKKNGLYSFADYAFTSENKKVKVDDLPPETKVWVCYPQDEACVCGIYLYEIR